MGEAKRRKLLDANYGKSTNEECLIVDGIKFVSGTPKNISTSLVKYTGYSRFIKFNETIYAQDDKNENILVPARQSSRYFEFKLVIEKAIDDLKERADGTYLYVINKEKHCKLFQLPISIGERILLGKYDPKSMIDVPLGMPFFSLVPS
ncbi:MAG: hypothetical protein PUP93_31115 [Rhizonema sp. NSF051]|nr:hypothetical protein [Rhizonema sp. NSF051]